jgi:spermidine synthase
MDKTRGAFRSTVVLHALVLFSGLAALSWEIVWQIHASLAIGVSAMGTAITLVATMGGLAIGSLTAGRLLRVGERGRHPARLYAGLEVVIGLSGALLLYPGFRALEWIDAAIYLRHPLAAPLVHLLGIVVVLGPAAIAMGATIPVFGLLAARARSSIAVLYGLNTAGAAVGVLIVSFVVLPVLGVAVTSIVLACLNLSIAAVAWLFPFEGGAVIPSSAASRPKGRAPRRAHLSDAGRSPELAVVFLTGLVVLGLEVAWFRAMRAAFWATTDSFAIILASVLVPLALGARLARALAGRGVSLGVVLGAGGAAVLCVTPIVERFDLIFTQINQGYVLTALAWLALSMIVLGPPVAILGSCLPYVLDRHDGTTGWGRVYAVNTLGAVLGSLLAAWVLLPWLGSERTAWLLGGAAVIAGVVASSGRNRLTAAVLAAVGLVVAMGADSGAGWTRAQGMFQDQVTRTIAIDEGPDSTIAVVDDASGDRVLTIDGFAATSQGSTMHYMTWMGRLPMLLHPAPRRGLVICFGTGQTANGLREEGIEELDVVELSPSVLRMAPYFAASNRSILTDPRVRTIVMDGRAWLRRTDRTYDVVTLEPMPPNFAGVNSLYSREFYQLVAARLRPGGIAVQWMPLHLVSAHDAAAIAATFHETFGDGILWFDPVNYMGILAGRVGSPSADFGRVWPGLNRPGPVRDMTPEQIVNAVTLLPLGLARWAETGIAVTDDNQLLAYGLHRTRGQRQNLDLLESNFNLVMRIRAGGP